MASSAAVATPDIAPPLAPARRHTSIGEEYCQDEASPYDVGGWGASMVG
jgi:hypothetical protein